MSGFFLDWLRIKVSQKNATEMTTGQRHSISHNFTLQMELRFFSACTWYATSINTALKGLAFHCHDNA